MPQFTIDDVTPLTREEKIEFTELIEKYNETQTESASEGSRRLALIYKMQANTFKELATDDNKNQKADANYEVQAIRNWIAYNNA